MMSDSEYSDEDVSFQIQHKKFYWEKDGKAVPAYMLKPVCFKKKKRPNPFYR